MCDCKELAPDVFRVSLPAPDGLSEPWGAARNVYVFLGDAPALIDTGYAQSTELLHRALAELGLQARSIRRIALTSLSADAAGAASAFPNATLWLAAAPPEAPLSEARAGYERVFKALLALDDAPDTWTREHANHFLNTVFPAPPTDLRILEDGQPIRLGNWILDAFETHGIAHVSSGYYAADRSWLFPGPVATMSPRTIIDAPGGILETLGALGQMSVKRVLPIRGVVDDYPDIFFRALSLYATNMRSNMKYIFETPQSSIDLVRDDFGYYPDNMLEFAGRLLTYDSVFREFADAGVMHVAEDGQNADFPRYGMGAPDAPPRGVSP